MIDLRLGDCIELMRGMDADSIDAIVTDPPYGLSFMGKDWDHGVPGMHYWTEALRIAKPGAYLLAFGGTRTSHRLACAIEDAGFEIRDTIDWVYGSGFPKSLDVSKAIDKSAGADRERIGTKVELGIRHSPGNEYDTTHPGYRRPWMANPDADANFVTAPATDSARTFQGYGTALKPAHEPIIVARKPLLEATIAANCQKWGTGALNIDAGRIGIEPDDDIYAKNPHTVGTIGAKGIYGDGKPTLYKQPTGRFPANLITDGSTEVVAMFPQSDTRPAKDWQNSGDGQKHDDLFSSISKVRAAYPNDNGSAARFFKSCPIDDDDYLPLYYCAKASKVERDAGCEGIEVKPSFRKNTSEFRYEDGVATGKRAENYSHNHHPTIKPISLTRYLATLILPPIEYAPRKMLVPFAGVASEMIGAMLAGWDEIIGIEREAEYCEIGRARLEYWQAQLQLALPMVTA